MTDQFFIQHQRKLRTALNQVKQFSKGRYGFDGDAQQTIIFALQLAEKVIAEPSYGMLAASGKGVTESGKPIWITLADNGHTVNDLKAPFMAMLQQAIKEVQG